MFKDFFEAPEIAVIFTTKVSDQGTSGKAENSEHSGLRVSKHLKKRDQSTKKTVRRSHGSQQHNTKHSKESSKACNIKMEDANKIEESNEENVYYDYDHETGVVVQKKHSVFDGFDQNSNGKHDSKNIESFKLDIESKSEDGIEQLIKDLNQEKINGESCPSDSAYDTTPDDVTDSLERFTFTDEAIARETLLFNSVDELASARVTKRESPYRRCRSSAICGRNCQLCRGTNRNSSVFLEAERDGETNQQNIAPKMDLWNGKSSNGKINDNKMKILGRGTLKREKSSREGGFDKMITNGQNSPSPRGDFQNMMRQQYMHIENKLSQQKLNNQSSTPRSRFDFQTNNRRPVVNSYSSEMEYVDVFENGLSHSDVATEGTREEMGANPDDNDYYYDDNVEPLEYYPYSNSGYIEQTADDSAFSCGPHLLMLYDFNAEHEDDITLRKGDVVLLLDNRDRDWVWVMTRNNDQGYVPRSLTMPYHDCEECRQEEIRQRRRSQRITERTRTDSLRSDTSLTRSFADSPRSNQSDRSSARSNHSVTTSEGRSRSRSPSKTNSGLFSPTPSLNSPLSKASRSSPRLDMTMIEVDDTSLSQQTSTMLAEPEMNNASKSRTYHSTSSTKSDERHDATTPMLAGSNFPFMPKSRRICQTSRTEFDKIDRRNDGSTSVLAEFYSTYISDSRKLNTTSQRDRDTEAQEVRKGGIRLIALSSFQGKGEDKLTVVAGDHVYVDLKDQKVPDWLWAYSPKLKKYGFIPESVIDQLKSSSV